MVEPIGEPAASPVRGYLSTLDPRQSFLIVCEGEKTEPNYFKKYRAPKTIIELVGVGDNTVTVVEKAIELRDKAVKKRGWL